MKFSVNSRLQNDRLVQIYDTVNHLRLAVRHRESVFATIEEECEEECEEGLEDLENIEDGENNESCNNNSERSMQVVFTTSVFDTQGLVSATMNSKEVNILLKVLEQALPLNKRVPCTIQPK